MRVGVTLDGHAELTEIVLALLPLAQLPHAIHGGNQDGEADKHDEADDDDVYVIPHGEVL